MKLKIGWIILIHGLEYHIRKILGQNVTEGTHDIRIALKEQNFGNKEYLEQMLINGKEFEEAIPLWFYKQKQITHSSYDAVTKPNYTQATQEIKKLIYIDDISPAEIIECLVFSLTDSFWKNQILSLSGLRKRNSQGVRKFDNLHLAATSHREKAHAKKHSGTLSSSELPDLE